MCSLYSPLVGLLKITISFNKVMAGIKKERHSSSRFLSLLPPCFEIRTDDTHCCLTHVPVPSNMNPLTNPIFVNKNGNQMINLQRREGNKVDSTVKIQLNARMDRKTHSKLKTQSNIGENN